MTKLQTNISSFNFDRKSNSFFKDIALTLNSKEINFLVGLSGSGKTTILKIIVGLYNLTNNSTVKYFIDNKEHTIIEMSNLGLIGYLSQNPALIPWITVLENIELPSNLNKQLNKPNIKKIIEELQLIGLKEEDLSKYPHQISFGMQARVALARTILYSPKFLFLDELFTGIDTVNNNLISKRIKQFVTTNDAVCLAVSHDLERAISISDNIYFIDEKQHIFTIPKPHSLQYIINKFKNI
jgi:ABC-type nitrate/sulfonate/bicarbonate transport system ATPase subunit